MLRSIPAASAAVLSLLLVGCAGSPDAGEQAGAGPLVIYNAQHEQLTEEWAEAFTAETGVDVVLRNASDSELANQLVAEGDASRADVFLTENSPAMSLVENAGLLAEVDQETLAAVPEEYRPASGNWVGIAARSTVAVYNPELIAESELPASLLDLADPEWAGRWGAAPSGADFQAIVSAVLETQGEDAARDWLRGMAENAEIYPNNVATMKAVNAGEIPLGIIYHYYWYRDQDGTKENSGNTALHYFGNGDPGAFVSVSGGGVLASSAHPEQAQAFLAWLIGPEGQRILAEGYSFEYPVAEGIAARPPLPPLDTLGAPSIDPSRLNSVLVIELMAEVGLL